MGTADGQEVLIVDGDEDVQRGLSQLFTSIGLQPTIIADPDRAQQVAHEKFFAVALVDLDTPTPGAGIELVRALRRDAAATTIIVLTARRAYEGAVEAFRAGARDIVVKEPAQIDYLKARVLEAANKVSAHAEESTLLAEVLSVHEDFLKRLMEMSRRAAELEERLGGGAAATSEAETQLLIVEPPENVWLGNELRQALAARGGGYQLTIETTGGAAIDRASAGHFHVALVCRDLPDLPGSMVVSAFKSQSPETITILFTHPGDKPGVAEVIEGSRAIMLVPEFSDASQVVERIDELRRAFTERSRERRYLGVFRQENYELLKRYAELKHKITTRLG